LQRRLHIVELEWLDDGGHEMGHVLFSSEGAARVPDIFSPRVVPDTHLVC
jgi:hypothetical protein